MTGRAHKKNPFANFSELFDRFKEPPSSASRIRSFYDVTTTPDERVQRGGELQVRDLQNNKLAEEVFFRSATLAVKIRTHQSADYRYVVAPAIIQKILYSLLLEAHSHSALTSQEKSLVCKLIVDSFEQTAGECGIEISRQALPVDATPPEAMLTLTENSERRSRPIRSEYSKMRRGS